MTFEVSNREIHAKRQFSRLFAVLPILVFSLYVDDYHVYGQNSTSPDNPDADKTEQRNSYPAGPEDNSTSSNGTDTSEPSTSYSNSTSGQSGEARSDSENSNSTSAGTNQTSTIPDEGQTSSNARDSSSNTSMNSTETESYQNNTSSDRQGNSTNVQPTNSTDSDKTTGTASQNATSYSTNSTQMQQANENATISSNANITDSVAVNQTAASLPPPDFDISIDPLTTSIEAGSSTTYTITVSSINGFNADVSLSITSRHIEGIISSLSSNMTRPPTNASSTLFLNVQSEPTVQSGKYKLKVTASSANISDSSTSATLEVIGKNIPLDQVEQFDPVALTPVLIKDMHDNIINDISSYRMVLISTTVNNNYNKTQPFIVVVEVRDEIGTTLYLQLQKGVLNPLGEVEVAISWTPDKAGTYQVRTFAISEIKEDPEPLSVPVGKTIEVK